MIKTVRNKAELAVTDAVNIIRILHARAKPNEQHRRGLRPITEDDAELAVRAMGFVIREFGWTKD